MAGYVFISHGSENRDEANELCAFIEERGVKAWIAPRDVRPGIDYSEALQDAIENCVAFVVLVTDMANKSPYVRAETEMAFSSHKPIFPVRQSDIKPAAGLAFFLKIRHWTDAYGANAKASMDRLALELRTLSGLPLDGPPASPASEPAAPSPARPSPSVVPTAPVLPRNIAAPPPKAGSGLSRNTLVALIGAGLLIVLIVVALALRRDGFQPVSPPMPAPAPDISGGSMPADNSGPGATPAGIDRNLVVGRWTDDGNCANAVEFTADGRAVTAGGEAVSWELDGDQLVLTAPDGQQRTVRITSVDQSAIYGINPDGSVQMSQRC